MKSTRRNALKSLALLPLSIAAAEAAEVKDTEKPMSSLVGSWHVTSATTSIILSIESDGGLLGMVIENGAYSIWRSKWKLMAGGVLVEGGLRFRLWEGRHAQELRAEMEKLPEGVEVGKSFQEFPLTFFMRRVEARPTPREWQDRPFPEGWNRDKLDKEWDDKAGQRRKAST